MNFIRRTWTQLCTAESYNYLPESAFPGQLFNVDCFPMVLGDRCESVIYPGEGVGGPIHRLRTSALGRGTGHLSPILLDSCVLLAEQRLQDLASSSHAWGEKLKHLMHGWVTEEGKLGLVI